MMYLTNGTLLQGGKYKIVRFLSSGGFGNTYEAIDVECNKKIAIKEFFMKDSCNRDETTNRVIVATKAKEGQVTRMKEKFMKEACVLKGMSHPNIVHVENAFEENATAYYVMDYIEGTSLNDIIKVAGSLSEAKALDYIMQIAEALRYVHSKNILHLDIKPGNIMVDGNGKAILIDFGASKQYDEVTGENTSTLLGINTTGYAPAEQSYRGFVQFSASTDIYALGATLYKLLTGTTPPDAQMLKDGEVELSPLPSNISASVKNAVKEAMRPLRKDRPQSIDEFVGMLSNNNSPKEKRRFVHGEPSGPSADSEQTILEADNQFARDVKDLCELTGKSEGYCERILNQHNGNKKAALLKIQTEELYKKCGNTELGIGRGTCKRYLEDAEGSIDKAEKRLRALFKNRKNNVDELFSVFDNKIGMEIIKKIYAKSDYNKERAEESLSEMYFEERLSKGLDSAVVEEQGCMAILWSGIKWLFRFLMMYVIVGLFMIPAFKIFGEDSPISFIICLIGLAVAILWWKKTK